MADQTQRLEIATVKAEVSSNIIHRFANDPVGADPIPTDSGEIQNLKQLAEIIAQDGKEAAIQAVAQAVAKGIVDLTGAIESASNSARDAKASAEAAKEAAQLPVATIKELNFHSGVNAVEEVTDILSPIDERNNVMFGLWDLADKLGLDLSNDGKLNIGNFKDVVGHILALEAKSFQDRNDRSGNMLSITDLSDALALAIENDGSLTVKGRNILKELDAIQSGASNNKWITPSKQIIGFGDSMSENTWQRILRELMPDRNIISGGVGGQKSGQIARRQGGVAPMITIANNTIPASGGVSVLVDVPFMYNAQVVYGRLYGVRGALSHVNGALTFTRSRPGVAVQIDEVTPFILDQDDGYDFSTVIFWAGNNDFQPEFRPQIDGNVIRMVDFLKTQEKRFFVIGMAIADYSDRHKGTPYYSDIMALHQKWRERWPDNFIDITPVLQRHYDPNNPTDVQNLKNGCTPSSLRVDAIHLNDAGNRIVANHIHDLLIQRGW